MRFSWLQATAISGVVTALLLAGAPLPARADAYSRERSGLSMWAPQNGKIIVTRVDD